MPLDLNKFCVCLLQCDEPALVLVLRLNPDQEKDLNKDEYYYYYY